MLISKHKKPTIYGYYLAQYRALETFENPLINLNEVRTLFIDPFMHTYLTTQIDHLYFFLQIELDQHNHNSYNKNKK